MLKLRTLLEGSGDFVSGLQVVISGLKGLRAHTSNLRLRLSADSSGAKAEADPASDSSKFASGVSGFRSLEFRGLGVSGF